MHLLFLFKACLKDHVKKIVLIFLMRHFLFDYHVQKEI